MQSDKKGRILKIAAAALAGLVLLVLVVEMAYYGITRRYLTLENNIYVKTGYTVSAEKLSDRAMSRVVATLGSENLTNGQLQVFYWALVNSGDYDIGSYTPLSEQIYDEDTGMTWEQYLITEALALWQKYQLVREQALNAGYTLPENYRYQLDSLEEYLMAYAENYGYTDLDSYLQALVCTGCTLEDYRYYLELYYTAELYLLEMTASYEPSQAEKEAYFTDHEAELAKSGITKDSEKLVDIRHILVMPGENTDASWEVSRQTAQLILDKWLAGEQTEDSFAALAYEYSADTSASSGGLCQQVYKGQMVEAFDAWCFEENRSSGDYGLVKTEYGYHVMYYVYGAPAWEYYSRQGVRAEMADAYARSLAEENPMKVNYRKIVLGDQK